MLHARDARNVVAVVNAGSRRGEAAFDRTAELLGQAGYDSLEMVPVRSGDDLDASLAEAVAAGPDLLVVGGGDGTVSCAAGKVAGSEITLGVLPLGTANDFARTLEMPLEPEAAVAALLAGSVVDVDLGRVNGRPYLNLASLGLSVEVTEQLTPGLKRRLGPVAYPVATLKAYRRHEPFRARLEFPDHDHEPMDLDDLLQVGVGNGRHFGGGNTVAPNASVDDHTLDVLAIEKGRMHEHLSIARFLRSGRLVEHEKVHHVTTRRVRVTTEPELSVNLDGEIAARTPATFEVEANAVRVVVPQGSRAARLDEPTP